MKKKNLFLLAGLTAMLTGCFGTRYTSEVVSTQNNTSIEVKQTLSLANRDDGAGKFTLTTKSYESYPDGYFKGFLGIGEVEGAVEYKVSGTESGNWTINSDTNVVTLETYKIVMKIEFKGDGAEDYKDIMEPILAVSYGEDNAQALVAGERVTIEYEEGKAIKSYCKLDETNKTFKAIL